jgi:mono/diheme cytochrome c family protein
MPSLKFAIAASAALAVAGLVGGAQAGEPRPSVSYGKPISEGELAAWDIDIRSTDGKGLPSGKGTVAQGKEVYEAKCLACHGEAAKGGPVYATMVGGIGSFTTNTRVLTPGSIYPYAPILFDYIRRAMPMNEPQTLTADEVYAVSAYLLHLNGLVPADAIMDAKTMSALKMPNRDGFIVDDRPDVKAIRCMKDCM